MTAALRACLAVAALSTVTASTVDSYTEEILNARQRRVERLTAPDGWLSLIGLHFLQPGANTIGTATDNGIVLAAGPKHFGTASLAPDGKVTFTPAADAAVQIDGRAAGPTELKLGVDGKPTLVTSGTVSFYLIERGGRLALRVKDSAAPRRTNFLGLDYFPLDRTWRVEARWVPFDPPREVPITNIIGNVSKERVPGKAVFEREGRTFELYPIVEGPNEPLFFVISDATSGKESYSAARFLDAEWPVDGKVVLDFNKAVNPPCAFTPFATCPLPPKENQLPIAVTAGEKKYRGEHE